MNRYIIIPALLLAWILAGCDIERFPYPDADDVETPALLKGDSWTLDEVATWEIQDGARVYTEVEVYGEDTERGVHTYSFGDDKCTVITDRGSDSRALRVFDNNQMTIGSSTYERPCKNAHSN